MKLKLKISLILLFAFSPLFAQQTDTNKELQQVIETFFEGFHKQDSTIIKSVVSDKIVMQSIMKNKEGEFVLHEEPFSNFLKSITGIPANVSFKEEIHSYQIKIDGAMANVWTPYSFYLNGNFSHCGVNNFQLFQENGKWKVIYIIDTRRRENCALPK